ncbi:hypothetical protein IWX78_001953 [Mycetocola sp. CAN_C7]|uniref:hypothetical protein n=1 Tax=Mycetocola sp. CAN_C7 TaxID=2787724 RepID=UPI0018C9B0C3
MMPFNPLEAPPGVARQYLIGRGIFMVGAFSMLAIVLFMFVSGLLAGGQFGPTSDVKWDVIVPWPLLTIPAWLVIAICVLPALGAVILAPKATWEQAPEFIFMLAVTVVLFVLLPLGLSRMYPDAGAAVFDDRYPELGLAQHWIGALPQVLTLAVLGIRFAMLVPAYNTAVRRSRENPS